jgi:hypothetical protein
MRGRCDAGGSTTGVTVRLQLTACISYNLSRVANIGAAGLGGRQQVLCCDVLSATPSPSTAVRLATTPRSTSALCVFATTSSRRPRPGWPTTLVYGSTSSVCICGDVDSYSCALDALKDADCDDVCGDADSCPHDAANDVDGDNVCRKDELCAQHGVDPCPEAATCVLHLAGVCECVSVCVRSGGWPGVSFFPSV